MYVKRDGFFIPLFLKVSCNFNFTMSYRYDILIKTTLCTAVFYTVQTEQAISNGQNDSGSKTSAGQYM